MKTKRSAASLLNRLFRATPKPARSAWANREQGRYGHAPLMESLEPRVFLSGYAYQTIASFTNTGGQGPSGGLVMDAAGDLFGTTNGYANVPGTIFEIAAGSSTITTLATFDTVDGSGPRGELLIDSSGDLFGVAGGGGANNAGTVFELVKDSHTITTLATFDPTDSGNSPNGEMVMDSDGDIFGSTGYGGPTGFGTIFEVVHGSGTIITLASYHGGANPGLVIDSNGDLFGATYGYSGSSIIFYPPLPSDSGMIFELPHGSNTITTYAELGGDVGGNPASSLIMDSDGNIFGATTTGGANGAGTIFELPNGTTTPIPLASLGSGNIPTGRLTLDSNGDIFGTTTPPPSIFPGVVAGPLLATSATLIPGPGPAFNDGSLFELPKGGTTINTLLAFNGMNATALSGNLVIDGNGNIFGTTPVGAYGQGGVFEVSPSPPTPQLVFDQQPSDATAGDTLQPITVRVEDGNGNLLTDDHGNVTLNLSSGTLSGTLTEPVINGVATFDDLSLTVADGYFFTASEQGDGEAVSSTFTISADAPDHLIFVQQPIDTVAGRSIMPSVSVAVMDAFGNIVRNDDSSITLAITPGTGPADGYMYGDLTVQTFNGEAGFSYLTLTDVGTYNLVASDPGLPSVTSHSFNITNNPPPAKLSFYEQPGRGIPGGVISPVVEVEVDDIYGNRLTGDHSSITLSITPGNAPPGAILSGTLTEPVINGLATFTDLSLNELGAYSLTATDGSLSNDSFEFQITEAGVPAQMAFVQQPTTTVAGHVVNPAVTVEIEDANGDLVTTSHALVTLGVSYAAGTSPESTLTVNAVDGIATFSNLVFNTPGTYAMGATSEGNLTASADSFTVTKSAPGVPIQLVFAQQPTTTVVGQFINPAVIVEVEDADGNLITTDHSNITITAQGDFGENLGSWTVAAVNGIATFSDISITTFYEIFVGPPASSINVLTATDGALAPVSSNIFSVISPSTPPVPPSIAAFTSNGPAAKGSTLTLTASGVETDTSAAVQSVFIYIDTLGTGVFDPLKDKFLGSAQLVNGNYSLSFDDNIFSIGTHGFFARILDSQGDYSDALYTTATITDPPSAIRRIATGKKSVAADNTITLHATVAAHPSYVKIASINFYWVPNAEGTTGDTINDSTTTLPPTAVFLGTATAKTGWKLTVTLPAATDPDHPFPTSGTVTFLAQAVDKKGVAGEVGVMKSNLPVITQPTVGQVAANLTPFDHAAPVTLTAGAITAPPGVKITVVQFWIASASNLANPATLDTATAMLLGLGVTQGGGDWSLTKKNLRKLAPGNYVLFARARGSDGIWSEAASQAISVT